MSPFKLVAAGVTDVGRVRDGNEDGFRIERCTNNNCSNFVQIAQVGPNVNTFSNTGLTGNKTYRYRVRAFNVSGNSAYSNIITLKTRK